MPVNPLAPLAKQRRVYYRFHCTLSTNAVIFIQKNATNFKFLPTNEDGPLNLDVPKPSFAQANAKSRSAFGFQVMASRETVQTDNPQGSESQDSIMGDDMYEDENKIDDDANIMVDEADDVGPGGNDSFSFYQCAHILYQNPLLNPRTMYSLRPIQVLVRPQKIKIVRY